VLAVGETHFLYYTEFTSFRASFKFYWFIVNIQKIQT
jgi:hypothetical protein